MKLLITAFFMSATIFVNAQSIYDYKFKSLDGKEIKMSEFKGKKILIVNTASECGYTPQYEGLQKLYEANKSKLVIIGFPANSFGGQEPGTNAEIKTFCEKQYHVTFPVAQKVSVKGDDIDAFFKWLINLPNPDFTGDIKWNFEKFLFDENGKLVHRFRSKVTPEGEEIKNAVM